METANAKTKGYTSEQETVLESLYSGGKGVDVKTIAADPRINKPVRSVIGKLVNMGLYVKAEAPVKTFKDTGPSKKEILKRLEDFGLSEEVRKGLENATKGALEFVADLTDEVRKARENAVADEAQAA